jgi:hypothetical protein
MTICVSVRVAEGLVLAADSATMLTTIVPTPQGPAQTILQNFNFANKVTHFKDYPIGVLTWGLGSIQARSIQSLVMEFEYDYPSIEDRFARVTGGVASPYTVREVADELLAFIRGRYDAAYPAPAAPVAGAPQPQAPLRPGMGLLIGGYSQNEFFSDEYVFEFPNDADWSEVRPNLPDGSPSFGANWYGLTDALQRLYLGYDELALNELVNRGADLAIIQQWANDSVGALPLVFDGMPLQDAIDFAEYSVQVVIGRFRFAQGPPLCGGDIDIAVVTPDAFRWAQRKEWGIHHE